MTACAVRIAASLVVGMTFAACATSPAAQTPDVTVELIRLAPEPSRISLTARMDGSLAVRNGCVHLISSQSGLALLAVWPPSYQLWRSNGEVKGITDTATGRTLAFGIRTIFGGGEAKHILASELKTPIPPACDNPTVYAEFSSL